MTAPDLLTRALAAGLLVLAGACTGDDGTAAETEDTGSSSGSGTGAPMTSLPMDADDGMTMTADGDSTTGEPPAGSTSSAESSGGPADTSSGPGDGSSGEDGSTTGGSGESTGGGAMEYPPCQLGSDPVCEDPYAGCYEFVPNYNLCLHPCQDSRDCPAAPGGDAVPTCANFDGGQCVLDCQGGATCPDGMSCQVPTFNVFRCLWPNL